MKVNKKSNHAVETYMYPIVNFKDFENRECEAINKKKGLNAHHSISDCSVCSS
jgi:hypothetical protein